MLAFLTTFITSAIDFRFGYVFAGCNLLGAIIVYFFLMESSQRTLEKVDTMYLTHVSLERAQSGTRRMRVDWSLQIICTSVNVGGISVRGMRLIGRRWGMRKG